MVRDVIGDLPKKANDDEGEPEDGSVKDDCFVRESTYNDSMSSSVVAAGDGPETFLACCVPLYTRSLPRVIVVYTLAKF